MGWPAPSPRRATRCAGPDLPRIAVVTADILSARMAGPAIRALHIARALAPDHDVELISTTECSLTGEEFACVHVPIPALEAALARSEIVIAQGFVSHHAPWLLESDKILIFDLYDPMHFEQLEQVSALPVTEQDRVIDRTVRTLNDQLIRGDFFLCASEQQRLLWLGQMSALGRVNRLNYARNENLDSLIAICPFGLSGQSPQRTGPGLRDSVTGISATDKVLLWAGGVYNWFDPLSLIRAVDIVRHDHDDVRLFFLGMKHPNPDVAEMEMAWRTVELSDELGLTDRFVFFNDGWVPYDDRANYLLDADVGVSTHLQHVETTLSFRTRILDYLWAGLPVISTGGDFFGELIGSAGFGVRVEAQDVDGLAAAITTLLYDEERRSAASTASRALSARFTWSTALAPLVRFCADPRRAADAGPAQRRFAARAVLPRGRARRRIIRVEDVVRTEGVAAAAARLTQRVKARVLRRN